ncbi:MAG: tetratricopeptide repeat protein [Bacteroidia bacterium]|nr:tetratricopeptide repeat protein [Bacteroidia bacterium]
MDFRILLFVILFASGLGTQAEAQQLRKEVYNCYINDLGGKWSNILTVEFAKAKDLDQKFEIIEASYGYIGYCMAKNKDKEADKYIYRTQKQLKEVLKTYPANAKAHALYGALLAMEIGRFPAKSMYLGPKSSSYIEKSKKLDPREPVAWVEQGNFRFHAPALFGGDKKKALNAFQQAVNLFEANPASMENNWMYLHALVWLGKSYNETGQPQKAITTYRKALSYEPGFLWVKNELLPEAEGR